MIRIVSDYENYFKDQDLMNVISRLIINQKPYQLNLISLLYRSNFIYNFKNKFVDMGKESNNSFGLDSSDVEILFFFLYLLVIT